MAGERSGNGLATAVVVGLLGLGGGAAGTYAYGLAKQGPRSIAPQDQVARPVANFAAHIDGLTVTCQNQASGDSGWWDFGDGTPLEPYAADKPIVTHTYGRPGRYPIKLTVRNAASDENERVIPVEVTAQSPNAPLPTITSFAVTPIGQGSIAPATFRVRTVVANADHCVWNFGDGRLAVTEPGTIERQLTYDKPGTYVVELLAHNGRHVVRETCTVRVNAPAVESVTAILTIIDHGSRIERFARSETVVVPLPGGRVPTATFSRGLTARPGFSLTSAQATNIPTGMRKLRVDIAADRQSAVLSGEWDGDPRLISKAGGSDILVPVSLTEERTTAITPAITVISATLVPMPGWMTGAQLPLPPAPPGIVNRVREYRLEIRQRLNNGTDRTLVQAPPDGKGSVTFPWTWTNPQETTYGTAYSANIKDERVTVVSWSHFGGQ